MENIKDLLALDDKKKVFEGFIPSNFQAQMGNSMENF